MDASPSPVLLLDSHNSSSAHRHDPRPFDRAELRRRRRSPRSSPPLVTDGKIGNEPIEITDRFTLSPTSARAKRRRRREAAQIMDVTVSVATATLHGKLNASEPLGLEKENKDATVMDGVYQVDAGALSATEDDNGACAMEIEEDRDAKVLFMNSSSTRLMDSTQLSMKENGILVSDTFERTVSGELRIMMENGLLSPALISSRSGEVISMMESGFLSCDDDTDSAASYSSTSTLVTTCLTDSYSSTSTLATTCLTDSAHYMKGMLSDPIFMPFDLSTPFMPCGTSSITLVDASCDPCFGTFDSLTIQHHTSNSEPAPTASTAAQPYEFDPYAFIRTLPCIDDLPSRTRPFALPRKTRHSKKITLVLDLDETLVHCNTNAQAQGGGSSFITSAPAPGRRRTTRKEEGVGMDLDKGLQFNVEVEGVTYHVNGTLRPHWRSFLTRVSEMFEVVVFTASQKVYADRLLNILDPQHKLIKYRLYRESCILVNGNYLKDLTILGRDMAKVVIVDNSPQAFGYQVSNGIPITSFYDSRTDGELLNVLNFLDGIANVDDVRPHIDCAYGLKSLIWPDSVPTTI